MFKEHTSETLRPEAYKISKIALSLDEIKDFPSGINKSCLTSSKVKTSGISCQILGLSKNSAMFKVRAFSLVKNLQKVLIATKERDKELEANPFFCRNSKKLRIFSFLISEISSIP